MFKNCKYCDSVFRLKPSQNTNYCSRECLNKATVRIICRVCNTEFEAAAIAAKSAKYCSDKCRVKSGPVSRNCEVCGKTFFVRSNRVESARFCSQKCSFSTMRRVFNCKTCGKGCVSKKSLPQEFCSKKCALKSLEKRITVECPQCHKIFDVKSSHIHRKHCSLTCSSISYMKRRDFPEPPGVSGARWIQLGDGKFTLVDDDKYEELSKILWSEFKGYARGIITRDNKRKIISLHRYLLNAPDGVDVDHANLNKLDNRL